MKRRKILICENDPNLRQVYSISLRKEGYEVQTVQNPQAALTRLGLEPCDDLLMDVSLDAEPDLKIIRELREAIAPGFIFLTSHVKNQETILKYLQEGVYDVLQKPIRNEDLLLALKKAEERSKWMPSAQSTGSSLRKPGEGFFSAIVSQSPNMKEILGTILKIAEFKTTCLVLGESGTGKELIARAIHENSSRAGKPFVTVNCGAIPENLLESELFGHIKGAFTGAVGTKKGLFEEADSGTVFLDEIGELPLLLQVKLLRVLQEEEVRRVGDVNSRKIDVRVIAATLKDLVKEVEAGGFREDLYYRLNVLPITLPPLRDRKEDIPILLEHFIQKINRKLGSSVKGVHPGALKLLMDHDWPGNIRELENTVERSMVLVVGDTITLESLPKSVKNSSPMTYRSTGGSNDELSIKKMGQMLEEDLILKALKKSQGNRTKAAKMLEISHRALLYKIKRYKIEKKETL